MKRVLITISLLAACTALSAQNLNPVVEVTNVYAREATGIEKPNQLLAVPDSVYKFDLDFDYSVKSTPYKGAYEFNPYLVQLRPSARLSGEQTLYLKAGAGFRLHPEVDFVWNPLRTKNFRLDLYASHNSYIGHYRNIVVGENSIDWDGTMQAGTGINSKTTAGANFWAAFKGGEFTADLQYRHLLAADVAHHRGQGQFRLQNAPGSRFLYSLGSRLAYLGGGNQKEFHTVSDLMMGYRFGGGSSFRVMLGAETVSFPYDGESELAAKFDVAPHYAFNKGRWNLDLGVKVAFMTRSVETIYPYKPGFIFPDVNISFRASDAVVLQVSATGGDRLTTYDSLLDDNPYLGAFSWHRDVIVNRFNVNAGLRGSIGGRFSYDIKGGFKWVDNAYGWSYFYLPSNFASSAYIPQDEVEYMLIPTMAYVEPLRTFYVEGRLAWVSEHWDILASAYYGYTQKPELVGEVANNVLIPPAFTTRDHLFYKWGGRIKVGATLEARSKLRGRTGIPAYQDLGIQADYAFSRHMAAWLKLGNLLNQTIQRTPFYAEAGIYGSVGVKLTF